MSEEQKVDNTKPSHADGTTAANENGKVGFILAMASIAIWLIPDFIFDSLSGITQILLAILSFAMPVAGLFFSILGMKKHPKGLAISGVAISILAFIFFLFHAFVGCVAGVVEVLEGLP